MNYVYDVAFEQLNKDPVDGILSCGFMPKQVEIRRHHFVHYGGFLVLSGKGQYINVKGESTPIGVGDFVQRCPGVAHTTTVEEGEPWLEFYVCFGKELFNTLCNLGVISREPILHIPYNTELQKKCESLLYAFKTAKETDKVELLLKVQSFILEINTLHNGQKLYNGVETLIDDICEQLSCNFDKALNLKEIAKKEKIGYENLRKVFKQKTGISMYHYRIMKRINESKRLLCYKDYPIKSIADKLGYTDQYAFSNQFKKIVGMSPNSFRKSL